MFQFPIEGESETASPSKTIFQSVGVKGVTTSSPQPQQHLWTAVAKSIEM
jgi:hypothetical protein